ncbi:MAG: hypothetical protein P8X42_17340 [Calditrichaceae bacterium]
MTENFIGNVNLPVITTVIFFLVFVGIIIWAVKAKKSYIKKMSEMPLDSSKKNGEHENDEKR